MTESNQTYRHSLLAAKNRNNLNQKQSKTQFRPRRKMITKANPKIRESAFHFAARIGEIIPDMPYLYEPEVSKQTRIIFLFSLRLKQTKVKNVKSSIFRKKTSKFLSSLPFKL